MRTKIALLFTPAILFLSMGAANLLEIRKATREDLHWTPSARPLTLAEASRDVEIYVAREKIERLLESEELARVREGTAVPVGPDDVRLRVNNIHRVLNGNHLLAGVFLTAGTIALALFLLPVRFCPSREGE
ncbi:MAG: hypothetical protein ABIH26_15760 [Candidatus Eisenbacteria bacterium]